MVLANTTENFTLSYTRSGAPIPSEQSPNKLFQKLFVQGTAEQVAANIDAIGQGRSLLDFVGEESKRLTRSLSPGDKQRMDQYFTAVRDLEQRLDSAESWKNKPKPVVDAVAPQDITDGKDFVARTRLFFDVMKLAIETDSTRVMSFFIDTTVIHNITHHGNRPDVLHELRGHEEAQFACLLIGLLFGAIGFPLLALLLANPRKIFAVLVLVECSLVASLSASCLVLWALFRPEWIRRATNRVVQHLFLLMAALFIPFAVEFIILLLSGRI